MRESGATARETGATKQEKERKTETHQCPEGGQPLGPLGAPGGGDEAGIPAGQGVRQLAEEGLEQARDHVHVPPAGVPQVQLVKSPVGCRREGRYRRAVARDPVHAHRL